MHHPSIRYICPSASYDPGRGEDLSSLWPPSHWRGSEATTGRCNTPPSQLGRAGAGVRRREGHRATGVWTGVDPMGQCRLVVQAQEMESSTVEVDQRKRKPDDPLRTRAWRKRDRLQERSNKESR